MKHVLLRNPRLKGWEYGVLRSLENEIIAQTGAELIESDEYEGGAVLKRAGHGMRLEALRNILPKKKLQIQADVLWCILMCPENYDLDLYTGWEQIPKRVLYIFDTLPMHFSMIKKLFSGQAFNTLVTSFRDAVSPLTELTGQRWHAVEQAVPANLFHLIEPGKKRSRFLLMAAGMPDFISTCWIFVVITTYITTTPRTMPPTYGPMNRNCTASMPGIFNTVSSPCRGRLK